MLVEALLVFALSMLIVVSLVSGSVNVSKMNRQIEQLENQSIDEKLRDSYGT